MRSMGKAVEGEVMGWSVAHPSPSASEIPGFVDERVFRNFYEAQVPSVSRRLLLLTHPGPHIEDLVQQTFLELHRSLPTFRGECQLTTWLVRITINVALQYRRHQKRKRRPMVDVADCESVLASPASQESQVDAARAQAALLALPEKLRVPFVLREIEGLTLEEVSAAMGCVPSTVSNRVERAKKKMIARIKRNGGRS